MRRGASVLCAILAMLCAGGVTSAWASRALLEDKMLIPGQGVPDKQIEGACGVALFGDAIFVSDYYHRAVDVFGSFPSPPLPPQEQVLVQAPLLPPEPETAGPCGLAFDASGNLYVNYWHRSVVKSAPPYSYGSIQTIDPPGSAASNESTGVAVDQSSGDVYVNDRTYVAVYEPSGAPAMAAGQPLRLGLGSLGDAYGVAVFAGRVYVPDAADGTIEVFEPAVDPVDPVAVIDGSGAPRGGFKSLVDASVAVDPTNGHLLVVDNLQPGFEHPEAAIEEFSPAGAYLGRLCDTVIDGEPSGLAFSGANLMVTSGNSEEANVSLFGPYISSCPPVSLGTGGALAAPALAEGVVAAAAAPGDGAAGRRHRHRHRRKQARRHKAHPHKGGQRR
jgi:hypothetical protein